MEKIKLTANKDDKNLRLDIFVLNNMPNLTRARIKNLIEAGDILLGGKVVKCGEKIKEGAIVDICIPDATPLNLDPVMVEFEIVYEDQDLLVINKPQGLVVHPCASNKENTLVNGLLFRVDNLSGINGKMRPGIVHRLDKLTSGLMLVAKNDMAHIDLSKQIETKACKRKYFALLEGVVGFDEREIKTNIGRSEKDRKKMAVVPEGKGKVAISHVQVVKRFSRYTLCEFSLKTGRTHQIRVHSKHIGHPVVGDEVYGTKDKKFGLSGQLLHSHFIEFTHPRTKEVMSFDCDLPDYFKNVINSIK